MNVALVRGKFLNQYEMQLFEKLDKRFRITAFGSLAPFYYPPFHYHLAIPVVKLPSPMDLPEFPYKMPILNRLFIDAHYLWGLEEKLRGFGLVHTAETYYHYTQQALNAKKKGYVKKVIATVLDNIPFNNEGIWGRRAFKKRAREELDHMIALSHKTKEVLLAEGADAKKITVVHYGIDTKRFSPTNVQQKRIADDKRNECTLLYTGRFEDFKGVFDVVEAVGMLVHDPKLRAYRLRLRLVGNGSRKSLVQKRLEERGLSPITQIDFVPYKQMPDVYRSADIFIAPSKSTPSWQEQWGMMLLEAQASGLPIVTTTNGSIPENVGDAALFVEEGDSVALALAIKSFILSPKLRVHYAQKARSRALAIHDVKKIASQVARVYDQVMSKK